MASDSSASAGAPAGKARPARLPVEPVTFYIVAFFLVSLACILALLFFSKLGDEELERYTLYQHEQHTLSEVALVTQKHLGSVQNSFQQMLLASYPAELEAARDAVSQGIRNLRQAAEFFVEGGEFTEYFAVNFDNLDAVTHTFRISARQPGLSVAALELRSSLTLLEMVLDEYYAVMRQDLSSPERRHAAQRLQELNFMHKKLNPHFVRAMEHSNRFYAQSMSALQNARQARERQVANHDTIQSLLFVAALLVLSLVGGQVLRLSKRVLVERAQRTRDLDVANTLLKHQVRERKQAQDALAVSERELRDLYALAPVGIFTSSPEGRYLSANQALAAMYGYGSPEEFLARADSMPRRAYLDPLVWDHQHGLIDAQGRLINYETPHKTKGGEAIWESLSIRAVKDKTGGVVCYQGFSIDITRRKESELAVMELDERFQNLARNLRDRMVFFTQSLDGTVLSLSDGFSLLAPDLAGEATGRNWRDLADWTPESRESAAKNRFLLSRGSTASVNYEAAFRHQGGGLRHLSVYEYCVHSGIHDQFVIEGVGVDITGAKLAEAELRALNQAIENAQVAVVITDTDGTILYVNPYFSAATGYSRQEALGKNPRILNSGRHGKEFFREMWETISRGEIWRGEIVNKRKNGTLYWESAAISPIRDERGGIVSYVAVKEVITDRKDLERLKEDVDRIMRHDLKTPLNAIIGFPQIMLMEDGLTPEHAEMVRIIEDAGRRMLSMIDLSLDLIKMEQGTYEHHAAPVDILALLRQLTEQNAAILAAKHLTAGVLVNGKAPESGDRLIVLSEERLLYSLLGNLFRNAIEASPSGEAITCEIRRNGDTDIALCNAGVVPKSIREHFFEKYKTHGKSSGTGLGTYSAKLLADAMGHDIRMETSDDLSTTCVTVRIRGGHALEVRDDPT